MTPKPSAGVVMCTWWLRSWFKKNHKVKEISEQKEKSSPNSKVHSAVATKTVGEGTSRDRSEKCRDKANRVHYRAQHHIEGLGLFGRGLERNIFKIKKQLST